MTDYTVTIRWTITEVDFPEAAADQAALEIDEADYDEIRDAVVAIDPYPPVALDGDADPVLDAVERGEECSEGAPLGDGACDDCKDARARMAEVSGA